MARPSATTSSSIFNGGTTWMRLKLANTIRPSSLHLAMTLPIASELEPYGASGSLVSRLVTSSIARDASLYATGFNLLFIPSAYLIGMMGLLIVPNLENPEMAIMEIAYTVLPPFAVGLVMAAIMAAIMSTADSLLLQTGTIAAHDLIGRFLKRDMDERTAVKVSRYTILVVAIIGLVFALIRPPGVFEIVVFATSVLGSAFAPAYVCAVWWKKANAPGAIASMIAGSVGAIAAQLLGLSDSVGLDPMLVGIVLSIIAIIVVSLMTQKSHPVPAEIVEAVEETNRVRRIPTNLAVMQDTALSSQRPVLADESLARVEGQERS